MMIDFQRLQLSQKDEYESILFSGPSRGCEYSFANLYLWGRQQVALRHGCVAFFSHFFGRSVYPYPIGPGDKRAVLEEVLADARERGLPCRISGLLEEDRADVERWFPGAFVIQTNRDGFDYVYGIDDLAGLRGRKYQKKRNHCNRFWADHPDCQVLPLTPELLPRAQEMVNGWYDVRLRQDPHGDYLLERLALGRAFRDYEALGLEGVALEEDGRLLAITMGSRLSPDTFDIHFEKAREDVDGAYAAVNREFARYLRLKYPQTAYLNREDDMGLEGLRAAKLSYHPHHMVQKLWAYCREDVHGL